MIEFNSVYEEEMALEQAIVDRIAAAEPMPELPETKPRNGGGRPSKVEPIKLVAWRQAHKASIPETAKRWNVSPATVKRLCRDYGEAAKLERQRWQCEQLDKELRQHEHSLWQTFNGQLARHLSWVSLNWFPACEAAKGSEREVAIETAKEAALADAERAFRQDWERCMGPIPEYSSPW